MRRWWRKNIRKEGKHPSWWRLIRDNKTEREEDIISGLCQEFARWGSFNGKVMVGEQRHPSAQVHAPTLVLLNRPQSAYSGSLININPHPSTRALARSSSQEDFRSVEISHFSSRFLFNTNELSCRCLATALTAQQWKGRRGWRSFVLGTLTCQHGDTVEGSSHPPIPLFSHPHPVLLGTGTASIPQSFIHLLTSCPKTKCSGCDSGCSIGLMPPAAMRCRKDVLPHGVLCSSLYPLIHSSWVFLFWVGVWENKWSYRAHQLSDKMLKTTFFSHAVDYLN